MLHAHRRRVKRSAFTLIELLLVLVILAVLTSIAVYEFGGVFAQADEAKAKSDIAAMEQALDAFRINCKDYPTTLDSLITNPGNNTDWRGPYLKKGLPKDPWGHSYIYQYPGTHNQNSFDLSSAGDGKKAPIGLDNWTPDAGKN
jgi:general secretion pathway protein G